MRIRFHPYASAVLCYIAVVFAVFRPILLPAEGTLVFGDDIHRSYHFFREFFATALQTGEFPWWNPYLFSGEPLMANPSVAFWYPVNWLFAVFPYRFVYSWTIAFHVFWAMIGMYVLMSSRDRSDRVPPKALAVAHGAAIPMGFLRPPDHVRGPRNDSLIWSWIAGLVFGLSGYLIGRVWEGHIELIAAASYLPWVVWSNIRCQLSSVQTWKKHCVASAVFFALQLLSGYQTMAMMTVIAVGIVTLLHCYTAKSFQPLFRGALAGLLGLGLAGIQIVPAREFFGRSIRTYDLPYTLAVFGSYTAANLRQLWDQFVLGFPWKYAGPSPNFGEMSVYMGKVTLVLSAAGFVWSVGKRAWMGIAMAMIAIFGLWVSFGWNAPVDLNKLLWETVPVYKYLRVPARHLMLFVFCMSALSAFGISLARRRLARLVIAIVIVVDMVWFAGNLATLRPDPAVRHNKELVAYLQKNSGLARIVPNFNVGMGTRDALDFDAAMSYRLFSASGYDPAILRNYYEFAAAAAGIEKPDVQTSDVQIPYLLPASRYVDFLNVKHVFVPSWFDSVAGSSAKYKLVMEENTKDYFRLWENTQALPRFFLVPTIVGLAHRDEIARAIRTGKYDPGRVVLSVNSDIPRDFSADCGSTTLSPVEVISYAINAVKLKTNAPCNAFLATSEVMYPGWRAAIDGKATPIIEGNLAFRTLAVPAGSHTIVLWYDPKIFLTGAGVTIATIASCFIWTKRKKLTTHYVDRQSGE